MVHPIVKSRKQHIRLWFEFYKIVLDNPELQANLSTTGDFYKPWGDCRQLKFQDWWKDHAYLFGGTEVESISRINKHPNLLSLAIPLNLPIAQTLPQIKAIIEERQRQRFVELGIEPEGAKSLKSGFGKYNINVKELRGRTLHEAHVIYCVWLEQGKPPINSNFLQEVRDKLLSRPKAKWLPSFLQREAQTDRKGNPRFVEEQIRQTRRSIKKAQDVCLAVSKARFPS